MEPTAATIIQLKVGACDVTKMAAKATSETPTIIKKMAAVPRDLKAIRVGSPPGTF
jgi:hypothetical protein